MRRLLFKQIVEKKATKSDWNQTKKDEDNS